VSDRFTLVRPTRSGRVGHPANGYRDGTTGKRRMFKCAGLIFDDHVRRCRWTYRYYFATAEWPAVLVWARATMIIKAKGKSFEVAQVMDTEDVPEDVRAWGDTQLVALRLKGDVGA
jgi:hypothetical protein